MMQTSITQIAAIFYELSLKPTHLYSNNICRVEICNVLYALLTTTHHLCPPPTDLALTILQTAYTRDVSLKVRTRCGFILQNLEKVIHPQKESLLFTIEARDIRNTFIKMGQENLLREFNVSNVLSNNANEDDSIDNPGETTNLQYRSLENLGMENIDKTHSTNNIIENSERINNKTTDVADIIVEKSHKDQVTEVNITIEDQMDEHNEIFLKDTLTSNKNIDSQSDSPEFVLRVDDDVDIAAIEDEEKYIYSDSNIDEPMAKKQKNYEHNEVQDKTEDEKLNPETDKAKNSNQIINMDQDEDYLLAEIASQFVDELD